MKLIELMEAVAHRDIGSIPVIKTTKDTLAAAHKTGKHIGDGIQTNAFRHKSGSIVKHTELTNDNDPVVHWVDTCLHNAHNPYLPKYSNVKIYEDGDGKLTMLSTCEPLTGGIGMAYLRDNKKAQKAILGLKLTKTGQAELDRELRSHPDKDNPKRILMIKLGWYHDQLIIRPGSANSTDTIADYFDDTNLIKAFEYIRHLPREYMDAHHGNWMFRENGELVLNDPVVERTLTPKTKSDKPAPRLQRPKRQMTHAFGKGDDREFVRGALERALDRVKGQFHALVKEVPSDDAIKNKANFDKVTALFASVDKHIKDDTPDDSEYNYNYTASALKNQLDVIMNQLKGIMNG